MSASAAVIAVPYDVAGVRAEFPILARQVNGRPLVYLDSACTALKSPACAASIASCAR